MHTEGEDGRSGGRFTLTLKIDLTITRIPSQTPLYYRIIITRKVKSLYYLQKSIVEKNLRKVKIVKETSLESVKTI